MDNKRPAVAYFCMEYGLHTDFKIYAGGLGILAGDHLKAAHDQDAPLVGIGLLQRVGSPNFTSEDYQVLSSSSLDNSITVTPSPPACGSEE